MRVLLLGTAAGGGFPQWNCACRLCVACRAGDPAVPPRSQDCLAVSADGEAWYLVNASPDIRAQVLATPALAPGPGPRDTPLRGALLTDAELDHTLGLMLLREGEGLRVWAPPAVLHALDAGFPLRHTVARYGHWTWDAVATPAGETAAEPDAEPGAVAGPVPGLSVTVFAVSGKRPKYARELPENGAPGGPWVVAYRMADPATGGALVYAPCLAAWPDGFDEFVSGASCVLLDGTFFSSEEMGHTGTSAGAQRAMGHLPIRDSLDRIARHPDIRWLYTHLNNTNPVLDRNSPECRIVHDAGADVPPDGTELVL